MRLGLTITMTCRSAVGELYHSQGVAFHGAYWHGNWGNRMSSGCVNMRSEEAKWLYRWCLPKVPFELDDLKSEEGTLVKSELSQAILPYFYIVLLYSPTDWSIVS